jgi:hypothetical protein
VAWGLVEQAAVARAHGELDQAQRGFDAAAAAATAGGGCVAREGPLGSKPGVRKELKSIYMYSEAQQAN